MCKRPTPLVDNDGVVDDHDDDANESEENDEDSNHAHYHLERCSFP